MSFREPNGVVMTVNMKLLGWKTRIAASSLRGRFATNQNGQAAKEKKQNVVAGAGCSENSSGFRLREKCFSLDIPFYRTSEHLSAIMRQAATANYLQDTFSIFSAAG